MTTMFYHFLAPEGGPFYNNRSVARWILSFSAMQHLYPRVLLISKLPLYMHICLTCMQVVLSLLHCRLAIISLAVVHYPTVVFI